MGAAAADQEPGPGGPTDRQRARLHRAAHLMDARFRIPGTRQTFGIDPILGLIPGGGDAVGLIAGAAIVVQAVRFGARGWTLAFMLWNLALDATVGSIPVLGTIFDVLYKANRRNVQLLERHAVDADRTRAEVRRTVLWSIVVVVLVTTALSVVLVLAAIWLLQQVV